MFRLYASSSRPPGSAYHCSLKAWSIFIESMTIISLRFPSVNDSRTINDSLRLICQSKRVRIFWILFGSKINIVAQMIIFKNFLITINKAICCGASSSRWLQIRHHIALQSQISQKLSDQIACLPSPWHSPARLPPSRRTEAHRSDWGSEVAKISNIDHF